MNSDAVSGNLQKSVGLTAKQIETVAKCLSLEKNNAMFADYGTMIQRPLDADRFPGLYGDGPQERPRIVLFIICIRVFTIKSRRFGRLT